MVLVVLVLLTGPLAYLPDAALAAVVFLIAIELIDVKGLRRILACRKYEFAVALLTTIAVVALGVEDGIVLAIVASIIDHLRHSYSPFNSVLMKSPAGHWLAAPITPGARTEEGLVVYRFGTSLYYANAAKLMEDVATLAGHGGPLRWMVLDCVAIGDIDFTASTVLNRAVEYVQKRHVRLVFSSVVGPVRQQLDGYGISKALGPDAYYETPGAVLEAFHATSGVRLTGELRAWRAGRSLRRAQFGFEQVHGLEEGSLLAGGELIQHPGQRPGGAVQPLPDQGALGRGDLHDGPAPVGGVGLPGHQPGPVQVGQHAADGGQGQAQPGGKFADGDRAAAQLLQRGDVPRAQRRGRRRGRPVLPAPHPAGYPREQLHQPQAQRRVRRTAHFLSQRASLDSANLSTYCSNIKTVCVSEPN